MFYKNIDELIRMLKVLRDAEIGDKEIQIISDNDGNFGSMTNIVTYTKSDTAILKL